MKYDLIEFKRLLPSNNFLEDADFSEANFAFQVLGLYCYLGDATFISSLPSALKAVCQEPLYLYDIIITDGNRKQKCLLRPDLAPLVQKKIIEVGSQIHIRHASIQQDERDHLMSYILICKIEVKGHSNFPNPSSIPFIPTSNKRENEPLPLVTGRQCYLNTWFMNIPYTSVTEELPRYDKNTYQPDQQLISLKDLSTEWKSLHRPYPPLLVVVLLQGKLHHYGKNTNDNGFPFQGYLEIADDTGICSAVLWQPSVVSLFPSLCPGTILLLENYNVMPKYPRHGVPVVRHTLQELERFNLEIKLNKPSKLLFVDSSQVAEILQDNICFPAPRYWFPTRKALGELPPNTNVDIIGLVTYVGRYNRELCTAKNGSRKGGFWVYRWIELIDGTSPLPIIVQTYVNGQVDLHKELKPGHILLCSQLRVTCVPLYMTSSQHRRYFYLTTTSESRLKICDDDDKSLSQEHDYHRLSQLKVDRSHDVALLASYVYRVGGSYPFPLCQRSVEAFKMAFSEEWPSMVTPCLSWKNIINDLSYKEHRRIIVAGVIIKVEFVELLSDEYGWIKAPYRRKHHCLFLDICRSQDTKFQETIGITSFEPDVFAHQYKEDSAKLLQSWFSFTPFSADENDSSYTEKEIKEIPVLCSGYFWIDITGVQPSYTLRAMMLPQPSAHPYPTLLKLLSGDYKEYVPGFDGNLCRKPTKYSEAEIESLQNSAHEIEGMSFICVLDLYCHTVGKVEIMLKRAFPYT